jgi:hypothetical protein
MSVCVGVCVWGGGGVIMYCTLPYASEDALL